MNRKVFGICVPVMLLLAGCGVNVKDGTRVAEAQGLKNVKIGSWSFFGCSKDDAFRSNFTAVDVNGNPVSGVICGGWLKGYTVRVY